MLLDSRRTTILALALAISLCGCSDMAVYRDGHARPAPLAEGAMVGAGVGMASGLIAGVQGAGPTVLGGAVGALIGKAHGEGWAPEAALVKRGVYVEHVGTQTTIAIPTDICFEPNTDTILESCYALLDDAVLYLKRTEARAILISGNTDEVGTKKHRLQLSSNQAKAVGAYFWAHGIPADCITTIGYGASHPLGYNLNSLGSYTNRRVQIDIKPYNY